MEKFEISNKILLKKFKKAGHVSHHGQVFFFLVGGSSKVNKSLIMILSGSLYSNNRNFTFIAKVFQINKNKTDT